MSPPLGLFGGTFDPVHAGHLRLATEVREALGLGTVIFLPAGEPWQRHAGPQASGAQRAEMLRLAVAGHPFFRVDAREIERPGPTYTADTLAQFRREQGGDTPIVFLCGSDAVAHIHTWARWESLLGLAHFAVAGRAGDDAAAIASRLPPLFQERLRKPAEALAAPAGAVIALPMTPLAISSTDIRARLARGRSARWLAPDAVLDYIQRNTLYGAPA